MSKRLFSSLFFGIGIFFVEGGGLFEHENHCHCQPERRRWQDNDLCQLGEPGWRKPEKVLLIDGDPQGSLTISLGNPQPDKLPFTLSDAMGHILMDEPIHSGEGILHHLEGVDLMPADIQLSGMEVSLVNAMSRETILRQYLDTLKGQYSHILIDCQPSLGMLTVNTLAAANRIIVPVQAEYRRIIKAVIYRRKRKGRSLHNRGCDRSLIRKYFLMNGNG